MERDESEPLTLRQAKLQALAATDELNVANIIRQRPWVSVGVSAALGFTLGRSPDLTKNIMELALQVLEKNMSDS